jgi:hypothetical protein
MDLVERDERSSSRGQAPKELGRHGDLGIGHGDAVHVARHAGEVPTFVLGVDLDVERGECLHPLELQPHRWRDDDDEADALGGEFAPHDLACDARLAGARRRHNEEVGLVVVDIRLNRPRLPASQRRNRHHVSPSSDCTSGRALDR